MTYIKSARRRLRIISAIERGDSVSAVARQFGICRAYVYFIIRQAGTQTKKSLKRERFIALVKSGMTWKKAHRIVYCSKRSAQRWLSEEGLITRRGARSDRSEVQDRRWAKVDWSLRDVDIALKLGKHPEVVRAVRARRT